MIYALSNSPNFSSWSINLIKDKKLPLVLNQNGVFYPTWYKGNWEKRNKEISEIFHAADYVIWQSNFCKKATEKFLGHRNSAGEILFNAIDTKSFYPLKNNIDKDFKFLITGNIRKNNSYRIDIVINAIKEVIKINKNIHLYIAGEIEECGYFVSKVRKLKLDNFVTFLGKYSQKDAPSIYQMANAYITMSYQDNCPSAVIEAMSCGLPILYSYSGGIPELVGGKAGIGLNVPANWEKIYYPNLENITKGILQIIEGQEIMSKYARERALSFFDLEDWIKRHQEIFSMLLDKKSNLF